MAAARLWEVADSGELDDWQRALANGLSPSSDDPSDVIWWRYGKWVPDVACSLAGQHLIVSGKVKARLASTRASCHRLKSLFVTDADVDWRAWQDPTASRHTLLDRLGVDEPEGIVCATRDFRAPDASQPLHELRRGLVEVRDPDLWVVFGEDSLQARRKPSRRCAGPRAAGVYRNPLLYRNHVCVDGRVREMLEASGADATIEFSAFDADVQWR